MSAIIWNLFRCNQRLVLFLCLELLLLWAASQNHRFDHFSIHIFPHQKYSFLEGNEEEGTRYAGSLQNLSYEAVSGVQALSNIIIWELKKEVIIVKCLAKILSYKVASKVATLSREHSISFPDVSSGYTCESNIWAPPPSCTVRTRSHESRDREFISEH